MIVKQNVNNLKDSESSSCYWMQPIETKMKLIKNLEFVRHKWADDRSFSLRFYSSSKTWEAA